MRFPRILRDLFEVRCFLVKSSVERREVSDRLLGIPRRRSRSVAALPCLREARDSSYHEHAFGFHQVTSKHLYCTNLLFFIRSLSLCSNVLIPDLKALFLHPSRLPLFSLCHSWYHEQTRKSLLVPPLLFLSLCKLLFFWFSNSLLSRRLWKKTNDKCP